MSDPKLRELLKAPLEQEWNSDRWTYVAEQLRNVSGMALRGFPLSQEDVEDLVQEVMLRFIVSSAARQFASEVHSPRLYLARMLRNAALDLLRKRERHRRLADVPESFAMPDEVARIHEEIAMQQVVGILSDLPPEDQELIRLRFLEEVTLEQIAKLQRISIGSAFYRLKRILTFVRSKLHNPPG